MHSEDEDELDFDFLRKTSQVDFPRKSTRSMSCYATTSSSPFAPRPQTMHANGAVNIIDLIDDGGRKSSNEGRRASKIFSGKGSEHSSKSRKLSKYLAKQRMSIAAIGTDLLSFAKGGGKDKDDPHHSPLDPSSEHSSETDFRSSSSSLASKEAKSRRSSYETPSGRNSVPNISFHHLEERTNECEFQTLYKEDSSDLADCNVYKLTGHRSSLTHTDPFDYFCKVVLLGDSGVGKTCFLMKYKDGAFLSGAYISTVGIDFRNKVINVDDSKVKLQIWDTAGQERFRSVTHAYYRDAHALLLLYDVTNKPSFDNTREWLAEVHEYAQDDVVIMLIGNKCDVPATERQIRREDGERLAREYNVAFMETSAKTGINVDLAFTAVARDLKARKSTNLLEKKFNVADYIEKQEKSENCGCSLT